MSRYSELRERRSEAERRLRNSAQRLHTSSTEVKLYGDNESDADWPVEHPVPDEVWDAINAAQGAARAVESAIARAKIDYRRKVLQWLLAEIEQEPSW